MPRARSPERDLAYQLWLDSGKKKKLKDIAEELGVSETQIRKWKNQDKWDGNVTKQMKGNVTKREARKAAAKVAENDELTEKQKLFCIYFSKSLNATSAYQKAYGCSYVAAMSSASDLLRIPKIEAEIRRLKNERYARAFLEPEDIFQRYIDIAFADIGDYLSWGQEERPVIGMYGPLEMKDPETGEKTIMTQLENTVSLNESRNVDTTLISEIKQGRDGISIKLHDRMKALEWLADHMDLATPEQKAKTEKLIAEAEKIRRDTNLDNDDGVEIINDAPREETDPDIGGDHPEVPADIQ